LVLFACIDVEYYLIELISWDLTFVCVGWEGRGV
jgi:hypothetical protein